MSTPEKSRLNGEGLVITEDGRRVDSRVYSDDNAAKAAAEKRTKPLTEKSGGGSPTVAVKQQLFG